MVCKINELVLRMPTSPGDLFKIGKDSFRELEKNDPLRLAGATAFFSTFALPAVVLIILQVTRLFLSPKEGSDQLLGNLSRFVGDQTATHLNTVLSGFEKIATSRAAIIGGFLFIIFVATTLFKVIKNSLNQIWKIKIFRRRSVSLLFRMRVRELAIIISTAILFLLVLLLEGLNTFATEELTDTSGFLRVILSSSISFIISLGAATAWFGLIFSFLPDGRYPIKICATGGLLTSILFNTGKLLLKYLLLNSNISLLFGKSAAIVLLLLFVFYTSLIFYFGAAFTKALAKYKNAAIRPLAHAQSYELKEKE
jgi:membrane protein